LLSIAGMSARAFASAEPRASARPRSFHGIASAVPEYVIATMCAASTARPSSVAARPCSQAETKSSRALSGSFAELNVLPRSSR